MQCIEGLSACTNLTSLYLYTNRITKIGGLDTLTKLHTLWLNGNLISTIQVSLHWLSEGILSLTMACFF